MMTHRHDVALIANRHVHGDAGGGVLGSQVPSGGEHGAPPMYAQLLPADMTKEVRWFVTRQPIGLTAFFTEENGAYTAAGPDGTYDFDWDFYVDYAYRSSHTAVFVIGDLLAGTGTSTTSSSASLETAPVEISAASVVLSNSSGAFSASVEMSADGKADSNANGDVTVAVEFSAASLISAISEAQLLQDQLSGSGGSDTDSSGSILVNVSLSGESITSLSGEGNLLGDISLSASSLSRTDSSADAKIEVTLSGASITYTSMEGNMSSIVEASAISASTTNSSGTLDLGISLSAESMVNSLSKASELIVKVNINAESLGNAIASGNLSNGSIEAATPGWTIKKDKRIWRIA